MEIINAEKEREREKDFKIKEIVALHAKKNLLILRYKTTVTD